MAPGTDSLLSQAAVNVDYITYALMLMFSGGFLCGETVGGFSATYGQKPEYFDTFHDITCSPSVLKTETMTKTPEKHQKKKQNLKETRVCRFVNLCASG